MKDLAVLVRSNEITAIKQIKNYEIDISVLSKALSNDGAYSLIQFVLSALEGFRSTMSGVGEAEFAGAEFTKYETGVWNYTIRYKFSISGR